MSVDAIEAVWSPARVALLRLHHALGLSAAVSAGLMGGVSRNAVISKRRRLGLIGASPRRELFGPVASCEPRDAWLAALFQAGVSRIGPISREPLPRMDGPPPPDADPKPLAQRGVRECAWPLGLAEEPGDYQTLFCCAPTRRGASFCAVHSARAYCEPEEACGWPS